MTELLCPQLQPAALIILFFLLQFVVLVGHCKPLLPCFVFHVDETICSSLDMLFLIVSPAAHLYSRYQSLSGLDQGASPAALSATLGSISGCTLPYSPVPNHIRLLWRWPLYKFRRLLLHVFCAAWLCLSELCVTAGVLLYSLPLWENLAPSWVSAGLGPYLGRGVQGWLQRAK